MNSGGKSLKKLHALFGALSMSLFTFILTFLSFSIINPTIAQAEPAKSDSDSSVNLKVNESIFLSLTTCDETSPTTSSSVDLNLIPSHTGTFKSDCQKVTVSTNTPGYQLLVKASGTNANYNSGNPTNALLYQNPNTLTTTPAILATTTGTITTPTTLLKDTWGFAVESLNPTNTLTNQTDNLPNFDTTYEPNNENNTFANMPTTNTEVYRETSWPIDKTQFKFYYATNVSMDTTAGSYKTDVTYTVIGEMVPEPSACEGENTICVEVTNPGIINIQNRWTTPITYTVNGLSPETIAGNALSNDILVDDGYVIEIAESIDNSTFRTWNSSSSRGFITNANASSSAKVSITKMPAMNRFTTHIAGTVADTNFFYYFAGTNDSTTYPPAITSLPIGSFDTSNITIARGYFFYGFNSNGALTSLPAGSFNTSKITTADSALIFASFNSYGSLTQLPVGSFNTSNITAVRDGFFSNFNSNGALMSLPAGSFNISKITKAEGQFFSQFNINGSLTQLPAGSFDTSNITTVGTSFFSNFNSSGALTSLPAGSFNTSNITTAGSSFFYGFNNYGSLTQLPAGSFDISKITTTGSYFFNFFNRNGSLTQLPAGSFDTSNITSAEYSFFDTFNSSGALKSLPAGSFDTSSITSAGGRFFAFFNYSGTLTSLPAGSFDTSNITSAGTYFFNSFNSGSGKLQAGTGVTITNKSSEAVTFWQRPFGNPDGTAISTSVPVGDFITFLAE